MVRQKKIDRPVSLEIYLPKSLRLRLDAALFSETEGKIPFGAYSKLGEKLFGEWLYYNEAQNTKLVKEARKNAIKMLNRR